jgi:surface antigen
VRRRLPVVEASPDVPAELARFRAEDWLDPEAVPPAWWASDAASWRYLRARITHLRACQAYQRAHAMTRQEWDQARGACGPACRRDDGHWHA